MARSRFQTSPLTPEELAILQSLEDLPDSGSNERLQKVGGVIVNTETGDVVGPSTHADNVVPRFDGTDTNVLQDSNVTISDLGVMTLGANGVSGFDAVTFQQLEDAIAGLKAKQSVRVATNGAGALATDFAAGQTVDGEVLVAGDRILIKDQAAQEENGIYVVQASGAPLRSTDADTWDELVSAYCYVENGTVNADKGFLCTINSGGTLGVDPITWTVFAVSGGGITSLNGLTDASQSFTTTTTGTDFTISSAAGVHSLNLPDASDTARGLVSTGTQTFSGEKTMTDALTLSTAPTLDDHAATKKYVDDQLGTAVSGTIAANEVAFGTGVDTIGGSSTFTYDSGTNVLNIESPANTTAFTVTDTPLVYETDIRSTGVFVDSSGLEKMSMNVMDTTLTMQHDTLGANIPTIRTQDETTASAPLNLSIGELRVNSDSGTTGQVLTSNGTGSAPTWEDAAAGVLPSDVNPQSIGVASPGVSADYSRADHVHEGSLGDLNNVSATAPTLGQVLAWSGTEWGPSSMSAYDQMLYVADGADVTLANGSPVYPFASISAALASITDATPTKRYTILITAGEYTEVGTVNLKPNVFLCGIVPDAVRITATTWALDPTFTGGGDNRTGIHNCIVTGAVNLNFTTVTSTAGKFYARNTMFSSAVTLTGYNNSIVQAQFSNCQFFGLVSVQGVNVGVANDNVHFNGLTLTQSPFNVPTIWAATGGTMSGTLTATTTVNDFNRRISVFAKSFWMGTVVIDGPSTYLDYTVDSLPVAGATVLNSANLVLINPATSIGANTTLSNLDFPTAVNNPIIPANTNATNMGDWDKQWMFNFGYVHLSSGTDLYILSAGASAVPDTAGRSIFIEPDGYGLEPNVNGGDINLTTQAGVSGTGVRGKIALNANYVEINGAYKLPSTDGTSNQVLTTDGAGQTTWQDPSGGVGGTIGATQIAFGTSPDTIGGDAQFTYDSGNNVVELATNVGASGFKVVDAGSQYASDLQAGAITINSAGIENVGLNVTDTSLLLQHDSAGSNTPTIKSRDEVNAPAPLALSIRDLLINSNPGDSGQVLTSLGAGNAPIWTTPAGGVTDGDYTDITVSGGGTVWTVDNLAITYQKIQNVTATDRILGRSSAGAGTIEEIVCTAAGRALLDDIDAAAQRTTLGLGTMATQSAADYLLKSGGTMTGALNLTSELQMSTNPGTSGYVLTSNGAGVAPSWQAASTGSGLPAGGTTSMLLQKLSNTNYDAGWTDEITVDKVNYDTTAAETPLTGQTAWNVDFGTLNVGMAGSSVIQKVGLDQMYCVKNQTGSQINKGQTIRAAGTTGNSGRILAALAIADNSILPEYVIGVAMEDIADGADGYVSSFGLIRQVDLVAMATAAGETWADGDVLYVSPTTPGSFTKIEPNAPDQKIIMAIVVHYHANGALFVRVTNGQHLYDLHDVYAPAPVNGQVLTWNASNSRWEATTPAAAVNQYHQEFTGVGGETLFNLSFTYTIGTNKLRVYKNGILLRSGTSYTETSTSSVTLTDALVLNDELTFEYIS